MLATRAMENLVDLLQLAVLVAELVKIIISVVRAIRRLPSKRT